MAPRRAPPPTKVTLSLDSYPVSLLWAHQLRREHAFLSTRLEELSTSLGDVYPRINGAVTGVKEVREEVNGLSKSVDGVEAGIEKLSHESTKVKASITACEESVDCVRGKLSKEAARAESRLKVIELAVEDLSNKVQGKLQSVAQKEDFRAICEKVDDIEEQLNRRLEDEKVLVKDSMEGVGRLMRGEPKERKSERRSEGLEELDFDLNTEGHADNIDAATADPHVVACPDSDDRASNDNTDDGDLDLDANMKTIGYAGHRQQVRIQPLDSLVMLPEPKGWEQPPVSDLAGLVQKRMQTWKAYLGVGQGSIRSVPRRKEGTVVEMFVNGILDVDHRSQCEKWLDERHWIWPEVENFTSAYGLVADMEDVETQALPQKQDIPCRRDQSTHGESVSGGNLPASLNFKAVPAPVVPRRTADLHDKPSASRVRTPPTPRHLQPRISQRLEQLYGPQPSQNVRAAPGMEPSGLAHSPGNRGYSKQLINMLPSSLLTSWCQTQAAGRVEPLAMTTAVGASPELVVTPPMQIMPANEELPYSLPTPIKPILKDQTRAKDPVLNLGKKRKWHQEEGVLHERSERRLTEKAVRPKPDSRKANIDQMLLRALVDSWKVAPKTSLEKPETLSGRTTIRKGRAPKVAQKKADCNDQPTPVENSKEVAPKNGDKNSIMLNGPGLERENTDRVDAGVIQEVVMQPRKKIKAVNESRKRGPPPPIPILTSSESSGGRQRRR